MSQELVANLLIVDDEVEIREMLARHFSFEDYNVFQAEDGLEALEILNSNKIDLIISDIVMPRMSGVELLEIVHKEFPMIRVNMITGYVTQSNLLMCMRNHADNIIYKPLEDLQELEDSVKRSLEAINRWKSKLKELQGMKV
ncbi:MAG: response regulator [Lentisphaeraceae bacterium]|nr:response regulator [Lentisphaeraceae bacterium]